MEKGFEESQKKQKASTVKGPVLYKLEHLPLRLSMAHEPNQILGHLDIGLLIRPPDIIDLPRHAPVQNYLEGAGHIFDLMRRKRGSIYSMMSEKRTESFERGSEESKEARKGGRFAYTYVEEVTSIKAVSVEGDGPIAHKQVDELGDDLFWVLVGAIDVVATRDNERDVERTGIGLGNEFGTGFGGSIRIGGL